MPKTTSDIIGHIFDRMIVLNKGDRKGKYQLYICQCTCGNIKSVTKAYLTNKKTKTKSCGCLLLKIRSDNGKRVAGHKLTKHPLYQVWSSMKTRCSNKNREDYHLYGGRGITICDEWKNDFKVFYDWAKDKWKHGLKLDRENNEGNYCPENCRFVDNIVQANNKRNNVFIEAFNKKLSITQWSKQPECKTSRENISRRIKNGWTPEKAIVTPSWESNVYYKAFGEEKILDDWLKDDRCIKITKSTFRKRLEYGFTIEKALTTPLRK